jgi:hypothetical protein
MTFMNWKNAFEPRQEIILSTVKKNGDPHVIYVLSMGILENKLVIGICLMKITLENIENGCKVAVLGKSSDGYFRIFGKAKIYSSGKYLEEAISHSRQPMPQKALVIDIEEVYDVGNVKKIL